MSQCQKALYCEKCIDYWFRRAKSCPNCRANKCEPTEPNKNVIRMMNDTKFECPFCKDIFKYGDRTTHAKECKGLNYKCPSEGCNHRKDMRTEKDVLNHLKKECKMIPKQKCKHCSLEIDQNRDHVCVRELKLALQKER